jgi:hypothetical protein
MWGVQVCFLLGTTLAVRAVALCELFALQEHLSNEDLTLWRDGIFFGTSGLFSIEGDINCVAGGGTTCVDRVQQGGIVAIDVSGPAPDIWDVAIDDVPPDYHLRPHGLFLDNATQRLFVVNHDETRREESIAVLRIVGAARVDFSYALVSSSTPFPFIGSNFWPGGFFNDIVVTRPTELYATQWGPTSEDLEIKFDADRFLWRCTWDESAAGGPRRRVPAVCTHAYHLPSRGFNGIATDAGRTRLWVVETFSSRVWQFGRAPDGRLSRGADLHLPDKADNVHYDAGSRELGVAIGRLGRFVFSEDELRCGVSTELVPSFVQPRPPFWQDVFIASAVAYGRHTLFVSGYADGIAICTANSSMKAVDTTGGGASGGSAACGGEGAGSRAMLWVMAAVAAALASVAAWSCFRRMNTDASELL